MPYGFNDDKSKNDLSDVVRTADIANVVRTADIANVVRTPALSGLIVQEMVELTKNSEWAVIGSNLAANDTGYMYVDIPTKSGYAFLCPIGVEIVGDGSVSNVHINAMLGGYYLRPGLNKLSQLIVYHNPFTVAVKVKSVRYMLCYVKSGYVIDNT